MNFPTRQIIAFSVSLTVPPRNGQKPATFGISLDSCGFESSLALLLVFVEKVENLIKVTPCHSDMVSFLDLAILVVYFQLFHFFN